MSTHIDPTRAVADQYAGSDAEPTDHVVVGEDDEQGRHWIGPFTRTEAERQAAALEVETGSPWEAVPPAAD